MAFKASCVAACIIAKRRDCVTGFNPAAGASVVACTFQSVSMSAWDGEGRPTLINPRNRFNMTVLFIFSPGLAVSTVAHGVMRRSRKETVTFSSQRQREFGIPIDRFGSRTVFADRNRISD